MEAERMAELRVWAERLEARTDNDELRAAGKAISLLVAELEELQARLVVAEAGAPPPAGQPAAEPAPVLSPPEHGPPGEEGGLRDRLKRTLGFQ